MHQKTNTSKKVRTFRILVTGDVNYGNIDKFNAFMENLYQQIQEVKTLATFGNKYGAQILARLYAQQRNLQYKQFTMNIFKNTKRPESQLYHILLSIGTKWADLVLIFSNIYTNKIKEIINICQKNDIEYCLIKE